MILGLLDGLRHQYLNDLGLLVEVFDLVEVDLVAAEAEAAEEEVGKNLLKYFVV